MELRSIGQHIRKYRLEKGMKQEQLAELTNLSANYIGMVERGDKIPSLTTFIHILNALNVSADMVLSDELNDKYKIKSSLAFDRISKLSDKDQQLIYAVIDTILEHTNK